MQGPVYIPAAAVAPMLGFARPEQFLRVRDALEDAGFPPPVPHIHRPLKWRADMVQAWLTRQRETWEDGQSALRIEGAPPAVDLSRLTLIDGGRA